MTKQLEGEQLEFLRLEIEDGNYIRADGRCICSICGKEYRQHPYWMTFHLLCDGHLLCGGRIVKT